MDLARQDRRISGKVVAPALIQAIATLALVAVEGPQDGTTLAMAVATILTAAVGWLKADCRYATVRQELGPSYANAGEGHLDQPD